MKAKTIAAAALAVLMLSAAGAAPAAAWTSNSDFGGGSSPPGFAPADENQTYTLETTDTNVGAASDLKIEVYPADPGNTNAEPMSNTSIYSNSEDFTNPSTDTYAIDINHSALDDAPRNEENAMVYAVITDTERDATVDEIKVALTPADDEFDRSVEYIGADGSDSVTPYSQEMQTEQVGGIPFIGIGGESTDTFDAEGYAGTAGNTSTVELRFVGDEQSSMQNSVSDMEAGQIAPVTMDVNGQPVVVYVDETPDGINASENQHVAVYNTDDDSMVVEPAPDNASSVSYDVESHEAPGFGTLSDAIGIQKAVSQAVPF